MQKFTSVKLTFDLKSEIANLKKLLIESIGRLIYKL